MNRFLRTLGASIAALCILAAPLGGSALAAVALVSQGQYTQPNVKLIAYGDVTAGSTYNSTSYADVTGSSFTYTPTVNDCTTAGRVLNIGATRPCLLKINWSFDVTKATSLTGTCAVYVNGAVVASSARTTGLFGNAYTIGGIYVVPVASAGTQTIKMQCKSADTAVLTLTNGHVSVEEIMPN